MCGAASCARLRSRPRRVRRRLPDVPTVSEFLPGFEAGDWLGVGAPKNTPAEIVDQTQQGDYCRRRRSQDQGALCRFGRHAAGAHAGRIRQAPRRRNPEMGQSHPSGQHQARVGRLRPARRAELRGMSKPAAADRGRWHLQCRRLPALTPAPLVRRGFLHQRIPPVRRVCLAQQCSEHRVGIVAPAALRIVFSSLTHA